MRPAQIAALEAALVQEVHAPVVAAEVEVRERDVVLVINDVGARVLEQSLVLGPLVQEAPSLEDASNKAASAERTRQ